MEGIILGSWFSLWVKASPSKALPLLVFVVALSMPAVSVSDSDMCFLQPIDQCSGDNFKEFASNQEHWFELDVSNAGEDGTLYLERKGNGDKIFTDVYNSDYNNLYGSNNNIFFNKETTILVDEGGSNTFTLGGGENTIDVYDIDYSNKEVDFAYNGQGYGYNPVGFNFQESGYEWLISDVVQQDRTEQLGSGESLTFDDDSGSSTLNVVNINDGNIEYNIDGGSNDFANQGETISHDGTSIEVAEVFFFGVDDPGNAVELTVIGGGGETAYFDAHTTINPSDNWWEYRARWVSDSGSKAWSDSIVFSTAFGSNLPLDKKVVVNGSEVNQPRTLSGVTQNTDITLTVAQEEQDPVNITLVDNSNNKELNTITSGDEYSTFRSLFDEVGDAVLATFTDTGTANEFTFPTGNYSLLNQTGTTYEFYFKIKDKADGNNVRTTKVYTVETSGTATNEPPNVESVEAKVGSSWKPIDQSSFGDNITRVRANVTDPDNTYLNVKLSIKNLYDNETLYPETLDRAFYDINNENTYIWNVSGGLVVRDSGDWNATVLAKDGGGNTVRANRTWSYPFRKPGISIEADSLVERFFYFNNPPKITVTCSQYECINENESINAYLDPKRRSSGGVLP